MLTGQHDEDLADEALVAGVTGYRLKTGEVEQYSALADRIVEVASAYLNERRAACKTG